MTDEGPPPITERLRWDDALTSARSNPAFLRSPVRIGYAIGAGIMLVGAMLPWAEGMVGLLPKRFGGFDGAADGLILVGFSIAALLFARSPDFLDAPDGARRYAPMLLGLGCVGIWLLGWQAGQMHIQGWEDDDGHGSMVIGYWIAGLGALIVAVVGTYATLRYHEGQTSDPKALIRLPRRSDTVPIATAIGAVGGLVLGAWVALQVFAPSAVSAPMLFMAAIGVVAGGYLGRSVGRVVKRRLTET